MGNFAVSDELCDWLGDHHHHGSDGPIRVDGCDGLLEEEPDDTLVHEKQGVVLVGDVVLCLPMKLEPTVVIVADRDVCDHDQDGSIVFLNVNDDATFDAVIDTSLDRSADKVSSFKNFLPRQFHDRLLPGWSFDVIAIMQTQGFLVNRQVTFSDARWRIGTLQENLCMVCL